MKPIAPAGPPSRRSRRRRSRSNSSTPPAPFPDRSALMPVAPRREPVARYAGSANRTEDDVGTRPIGCPIFRFSTRRRRRSVDESNRAHVLEDTLASFGVGAKVVHIERGPSITRYELQSRARRQDFARSPRWPTTSRWRWPRPACASKRRFPESPRSASRFRTQPSRSSRFAKSSTRFPTAVRYRRCGWRSAKTSPAGRSSATSARCRTCWSPARPAPANRSASTRSSRRCS